MRYLIVVFILFFSSCIHRVTIVPEIKGNVYNKETLMPESDVTVTLILARQVGGRMPLDMPLTNNDGLFHLNKVKEWEMILPSQESGELMPCGSCLIILKKDGYLPDSILLDQYKINYVGDRSYMADSLFFTARKMP